MNTNLKTKKRLIECLLMAAFILAPVSGANAQSEDDEFGVWTTLEASKKINKKLKLDFVDIPLHTSTFLISSETV